MVNQVGGFLPGHPVAVLLVLPSGLGRYQQGSPCFVGMVVGRVAHDVLRTALDDQQVAVLDARDELHPVGTQFLVQVLYQLVGILRLQVTSVVRDDAAVFERDDVAPDGEVVVGHFIAYAGGLQWSAAFVYLVQVVSHDGRIGHLASRGEPFGNGNQPSRAALARQHVHIGLVGVLQERLSPESFNGMVGHSVA